ncbi:MAG: RecQ family ATP-dependent DNA helicase, partial [Oscillospiraceae bacterium]|nr:RecQ family ATP-dependent DNA helicase [Oscillospiraceae bacterium]
SLLAVDEAHCVSQWGQDFRQNYLDIPVFVQRLPRRPVLAAFTATATEELRADIVRLLQLQDPCSVTTGFDRPNLFFDVRRESGKLEWLKNYLRTRQTRSGIVYCSTRKTVDQVCQALREAGFAATRYHAGLEDEERRCNQEDFAFDRATVMVATNAFGMGIDKSNVSFVIHYNMPKNMESYYQEAGRAGRDGSPADCILLYSPGDVVTARYLITEGSDREQVPEPLREVLLQRDLSRLRQMTEYCKTEGCFRAALLEYFGESHSADCGNCGNCRPVADELQGESVEEDITLAAQKILSCLRRVERKNRVGLGESTIVSILAGSREKRILKWEYDLLPTYGLMRDVKRTLLRQYIQELRRQGFLHLSSGDFDVLTTTGEADKVLFHGQQVLWRHRIDAGTSSTAAGRQLVPGAGKKRLDAGSSELFEQLRALRAELARQANVPAYVILPDATLLELAQKQPTTPELLAGISGLGEKRIERYGAALLELLQRWRAQREANWTLDRGSYPGNLLYDIFEEAAFLPQDVEARLQKTLDTLLDASGREILLRAYRDQKRPAEIGAEQSLSEERIQQNLEQSLRKLRRKSSRAYLRGDSEHLAHGRETQPSLRLRADQLAGYVCKPEGLSVTSFARSLTALKEAGQEGSLSGSQLFDWLLERGLLTERLSEAD